MSKEAIISFPKKKMLEVDDFDFQIKSQEGTKVIKLSNFNETELGEEVKGYNTARKENQELLEFLDAGPPNLQGNEPANPAKRVLFGWKKKPSKKDEEDFRGSPPPKQAGKPQGNSQVNSQSMPSSQKFPSQRVASSTKSQVIQPAQQASPNQYSNHASLEQPAPPNNRATTIQPDPRMIAPRVASAPKPQAMQQFQQNMPNQLLNNDGPVPPNNRMSLIHPEARVASPPEVQQSPSPVQPDLFEENAQLYVIDPVLMKNTDFNASFIHVDDLGKSKPKNTLKGVKFSSAVDTIGSDSEIEEEVVNGKPTFAPRGSSMKNLEVVRSGTHVDSMLPNRKEPSRPQTDSNPQENRPKMRQEPSNEVENGPQEPPKLSRSRSFDEVVYPAQHPSTMPALPVNSKMTFPSPPQQRFFDPQPRKMSPSMAPVRKMSDSSIAFARKLSDHSIQHMKKPSDSSRTSDVLDKYLPSPSPTSDKSLQTEKDDRDYLLNTISQLQAQLVHVQEENFKQATMLQDQKKGFDKLSAQAYKKIKELLTDRNIMVIELKSLRSQVDKMESQYDEWSADVEE